MNIADQPPGLISRRAFPTDGGRIVIEEHWDISVAGCPMIRSPWHPQLLGNEFIRRVTMTESEFRMVKPQLFDPKR